MTATIGFTTTDTSETPDLFDDEVLDAFTDNGLPAWTAPLLVQSIERSEYVTIEGDSIVFEWVIVLGHDDYAVETLLKVWDGLPHLMPTSAGAVSDRIVEALRGLAR